MKKQMKLLTCLTKPFVLFLLLFALGVGDMWGDPAEGDNWYHASSAQVYFDNTNSNYSNVAILIGRNYTYSHDNITEAVGSEALNFEKISGTNNLYYCSVSWSYYRTYCFIDAHRTENDWKWGAETVTTRMAYATSTTTPNDNLGSSTHLYVPASDANNCAVSHTTPASYDGLNYTQTVQQALTTDGGSTYAASTVSLATVKVSSYYLSAASTASATGDKVIAAGQSSNSCKAARTATVTYTVSDVQDGYEFLGWFDGSTKKSTATTYDYQATEAKTITARFAPKFTIETLYLVTNANWRGSSARFAAVFCNRTTQQWEDCSVVDGTSDEIYTVDVPEGDWSFVIFCRMNPTRTGDNNGNNWDNANRWNQTSDMVAYGNSNCVYITGDGSDNQRWGKYAPSLALVGTMNNWDPVANPFTDNVLELNTLAAHSGYNFKIANGKDDTWYGFSNADNKLTYVGQTSAVELGSNDHNILLLTAGTGNYTFTWDATEHTLAVAYPEVTHPSVDYVYVRPYSDWTPVEVLLTGGTISMVAGAGSNLNSFEFNDNDYYYAAYGDNTTVVFGDGPNGPLDGHKTDALTISGNEGKYYYAAGEYKDWQWLTFQVGVGLNDLSAGTSVYPNYFSVQLNSTDLLSEAVITTLPEKENYEFEGFCVNSDGSGTEIIDKDGNWNTSVAGYTDATPKWIHAGTETTLYAKWTEILHDVDVEVSPAGAGSVQVSGSPISKIEDIGYETHSAEMTAVPTNALWVFKEWRVSDDTKLHLDLVNYSTTGTTMKVTATGDDQTLTAVFVKRYELVGSVWDGSKTGGMPGWEYDGTGDFNINSFTAVDTDNGVDLSYSCSLTSNTVYKLRINDRGASKVYGKSDPSTSDYYTLPANTSAELSEYGEGSHDVWIQTGDASGLFTFRITKMRDAGSGNMYYPTISVDRPQQVNFGWKYINIGGSLTSGDVGGTVAVAKKSDASAVSTGSWLPYGTVVTYTATPTPGYTVNWHVKSDYSDDPFSHSYSFDHAGISTGNGYAEFSENATTVTLSNDGNGKVQIGGEDKTNTTCGVTTTRELTAVANDGYMFSSWTKTSGNDISISSTSTNPTTLTGLGSGLSSGQTVTANFTERWQLKAETVGWGSATFTISNISTVGGDAVGYVDITLSANTSYEFTIVDLQESETYKNGTDKVYYMTNGNSYVWGFGTDKTYNCGITTAGAGTYRFMWNITDKKMSVIYPNFVIYRTGDKDEDSESSTHTISSAVESYIGGTISQAIEFRMKVRELDKWYTLCLPFTVNKVCVWDAEDGKYYEMKPYYRPTPGGIFYTGHYVIRSPYGEGVEDVPGVEIELAHFDDWRDPVNASVLPSASTPYIIQWHHSYFSNRYISFFGATGQMIPTSMTSVDAPSANDKVRVCGNDAMKKGEVAGAYLLDNDYGSGAWLRDENVETVRTILPFECYIIASDETTGRYLAIRRGMTTDDTPTGWDDVLNSERKQIITVYTLSGFQVTQYNDCSFNQAAQRLHNEQNEGIFILRSENESIKLMVGGK